MKHIAIVFIFQLFSFSAVAGNIANVFSEGIFGVKWGSNKDQVIEVIPGGKIGDEFGIVTYTIKNGRTLFGIERRKNNYAKFNFDSNDRLVGATIEFPDSTEIYGALLTKINTTFGQNFQPVPNSLGAAVVKWPEEEGITLLLSYISGMFNSGSVLFSIGYRLQPANVSKDELGFK